MMGDAGAPLAAASSSSPLSVKMPERSSSADEPPVASSSQVSSPASSRSTIRAANESTGEEQSARQGIDWRARSLSAPSSRTSSFARNLDQLAGLSQSAHRFPITLDHFDSSTRQPAKRVRERSREGELSSNPLGAPSSGGEASRTLAVCSTPASPHLSPLLSSEARFNTVSASTNRERSLSSEVSTSLPTRTRSALFTLGAGFTPAFDASERMRPGGSTPLTSGGQASPGSAASSPNSRMGRLRSTSASESVTGSRMRDPAVTGSPTFVNAAALASSNGSLHGSTRPRRPRAHSARTSPALRPLRPLTDQVSPPIPSMAFSREGMQAYFSSPNADEQQRSPPQRTNSTPHLARLSPILVGYPYACNIAPGATFAPASGEFATIGGYFALPPSIPMLDTNMDSSSAGLDNLPPPPYTPSDSPPEVTISSRPTSAQAQRRQRSVSTSNHSVDHGRARNEETQGFDPEEDGLSFSTGTSRSRARAATVHAAQNMRNDASIFGDSGTRPSDSSTNATSSTRVPNGGALEAESEAEGASDHATRDRMNLASPLSRSRILEGPSLAEEEWNYLDRLEHPSKLRQFVLTYLAHPLRLLAIVPGSIGTFWLLRNAAIIAWKTGGVVWKTSDDRPSALEFALSSLWSTMTAYHALSFTTLLLRRWLHYYSLLPSIIRLLALQALCWPLVRLTLFLFGPRNPLPAWILISVTTAFSDTVARWVVSNITDESDGLSNASMGIGSPDYAPNETSTVAGNQNKYRSGFYRRRLFVKRRSRGLVMAFWRAIMGAPPRQRSGRLSASMAAAERGVLHGSTVTESEAESDAELWTSGVFGARRARHGAQSGRSTLRRRAHAGLLANAGHESEVTSGGDGDGEDEAEPTAPTAGHVQVIERVGRIFHLDVAVRRNVLPIGILAYLTMWILLMEDVRKRWRA